MAKAATKSKSGKKANAKGAGGAGGAKSAKSKTPRGASGVSDAIFAEALERAAASVRAGVGLGKGERSAPGTYALKLRVAIDGDIARADDSNIAPTSGTKRPVFDDAEFAAGLLALVPPTERESAIERAVKHIALARQQVTIERDALLVCADLIDADLTRIAESHGLIQITGGSDGGTKAGALSGKPGVKISGTVNGRKVEITAAA